MNLFTKDNKQFDIFIEDIESIIKDIEPLAKEKDINELQKMVENFKFKTEDFYRENRKLNIGVVGQVKAGKSSFLNTLLFDGEEILPKASTPKTATLTKMEYSEQNMIQIDYYDTEEWDVLEDNAACDMEEDIYKSAREIIEMVRRSGLDVTPYLEKGKEQIYFDTYAHLIENLNNYVGEDGMFTPIVKAATLYLNKDEFRGLSIVDTPGLNDPISSRTLKTKEFMEVCDVVFFLSQSGSFLDKSDWELLSSQLPQKGVKRLALVASKYDSGVRDVLRVQEEDDIFGDDDNSADNIPDAYQLVKQKLGKRARIKIREFVKDMQQRECSEELIEIIQKCEEPYLISSMAYNMTQKSVDAYNEEEKNIYTALKQFSSNIKEDLYLLGNFEGVKTLFREVEEDKEEILEQKAKSFIPTAKEELKGLLFTYKEKTAQRIQLLEGNDKEQILEQKQFVEQQIGKIKADIISVFAELHTKLEMEKAEGIRELRDVAKDHMDIKERTGTKYHTGTSTSGHLWWKKTERYFYEEHYSYCLASDAIDNLRKYALEATNEVEKVFTEALELQAVKRKLLNVVINNFDMGNEKYDSSLFRIMVEETVSKIEFPVIQMDISDAMQSIASKFTGEITSGSERGALSRALANGMDRVHDELCNKLIQAVADFKMSMKGISHHVEISLLENITQEFESLLEEFANKELEIERHKQYASSLDKNLNSISNR